MGRPPLNLDYAFGVVIDQVKPLDYQRVIDSTIPLRIAITLVDEIRTLVPEDLESGPEAEGSPAGQRLAAAGSTRDRYLPRPARS